MEYQSMEYGSIPFSHQMWLAANPPAAFDDFPSETSKGPKSNRGFQLAASQMTSEPLKIAWLIDCYRGLYYLVYWGL
jgi:hypothetical protein